VVHGHTTPHAEYGEGPEVYQPPTLQVCQSPTAPLEVDHFRSKTPFAPEKGQEIEVPSHKKLWKSQKFWLILILVVVVIAAAVGGGVGGTLAVRNAK
jgi:anti-sigma-K factor RskA